MSRTLPLLIGLGFALILAGCDTDRVPRNSANTAVGQPSASQGPSQPAAAQPADSIKICSFNIQVFGTGKLKKPQAMQVLTEVVRRFDVVAIQEVRSVDDTVVPRFLEMVNSAGAKYDFIIGPRLGRTNSREQYAVLFNTERMEVDRGAVYTADDPKDLLHREPLVARFRVRGLPSETAFSFNLVNIHTDPDETATELDALADVFVGVQQNGSGEDDVILLGDLNVNEYRLGRLGLLPGIAYAVTGTTTNTRRDKMYDNIVFDRRATSEFTGRWGVLDLAKEFSLTEAAALEVSDHCPVWAEFAAREGGGAAVLAGRPGSTDR